MFNPADRIMEVAAVILEARLAADQETAIAHWRKAVEAQDQLACDEPPAWHYPARESLVGALLRSGQAAEAEAVFREDLKRNPHKWPFSVWPDGSLKTQKKAADAEWVRREFESAWQHARVRLQIEDL